jgi:hypothetical protein
MTVAVPSTPGFSASLTDVTSVSLRKTMGAEASLAGVVGGRHSGIFEEDEERAPAQASSNA